MPVDARIALAGIQPDFDGVGAYQSARANQQTYRTNQMAQQAAQETAARNAMARQRAAGVDPANRPQVNAFVREVGADVAAPYLEAWNNVGSMFRADAAEARAQGEFGIKEDEAAMTELRTVVGRVWANPDDASLADAAQRYPQFAADISRIAALPDPAARQSALATMVAALPGGSEFLNSVTQQYDEIDLGGSIRRTPKRPYLPGGTQTLATTPDPRAPQYLNTANGIYAGTPGGPATPVTGPDGNILQPYDSSPPAPAANADGTQAASAETLRDVLRQLDANFETLYQNGFMRGSGISPVGNVAQFVGDAIPGVRGARLATNSAADTASGNVEALLSTAISTLSALYGTSSRVMDAVKEMENARSTFGGQNLTIEAARNMVATALRRVDELEASRSGGGSGGGDSRAALEAEARRRGLIQ